MDNCGKFTQDCEACSLTARVCFPHGRRQEAQERVRGGARAAVTGALAGAQPHHQGQRGSHHGLQGALRRCWDRAAAAGASQADMVSRRCAASRRRAVAPLHLAHGSTNETHTPRPPHAAGHPDRLTAQQHSAPEDGGGHPRVRCGSTLRWCWCERMPAAPTALLPSGPSNCPPLAHSTLPACPHACLQLQGGRQLCGRAALSR